MTAQLTHKELAAHLRKRYKHEGIDCRVIMMESCGGNVIKVARPAPDAEWTYENVRMIKHIAKCNRLTSVFKTEIDVDLNDSGKWQYEFYL